MIHGSTKHVIFTGGGSGGHLFPGLAVAGRMVARWPEIRITFAGCGKPFDREQVEAAGFEYLPLRCCPLPRRPGSVWRFVVENLVGYCRAGRFLDRQPADVVVGLGGYASVPLARAALRRAVPLLLLEQNAVAGRATRWLAPSAALVCLAFAEASESVGAGCSTRLTGTPLRDGFGDDSGTIRPPGAGMRSDRLAIPPRNRLLVVGGSSGARSLNRWVPPALGKVAPLPADWEIVHQTGLVDLQATKRLYRRLQIPATVVPFIADMAAMLRATGLAVCRAGGTTLAELAQSGVPAILLPYPYATDDHQRKNARAFAASGGCVMLDGRPVAGDADDPLPKALVQTLSELLTDAALRDRMSLAVGSRALPGAAEQIAELVRRLAA